MKGSFTAFLLEQKAAAPEREPPLSSMTGGVNRPCAQRRWPMTGGGPVMGLLGLLKKPGLLG